MEDAACASSFGKFSNSSYRAREQAFLDDGMHSPVPVDDLGNAEIDRN